jgi:c-di-GMP-binding flagellar brake protein YcgR
VQLPIGRLSEPLTLWEKIEVTIRENKKFGRYLFRIEDIVSDGLVVSEVRFLGGEIRLRNNAQVTIGFTRKDAAYEGYSVITRWRGSRDDRFLLTIPKTVHRVQRRQYVRIEMTGKAAVVLIDDAIGQLQQEQDVTWTECSTVDLSGGGVLIRSQREFSGGDLLLLHLPLLEEAELPSLILGTIKRVFSREECYFAGVEFLTGEQAAKDSRAKLLIEMLQEMRFFDEVAQDKLVTFVFQKQIELRQKGLL